MQSAKTITLAFILFELFPLELCPSQNHVRSTTWNHSSFLHKTSYKYQSTLDDVQNARTITLACILFELFPLELCVSGGGWVMQRCRVSCITGASDWYWFTVGQGLLSLQQVRVEGECFYFLFLHFHSLSSFSSVPLFHLLYYLFYLSSPFLWETTENDPQGLTCRQTPTQTKTLSVTKWRELCNLKTVQAIFTKLHININQH